MAKYTVEVSTIMCSTLGLLDTFKKMDMSNKKHYLMISESLNPSPIELVEEFGIAAFDYYFPKVGETTLMSKTEIWASYKDEFKKQFWYEFWSKEIAQENPMDWQRLVFGRMRKSLPILMIEIEQLLTNDQAFITATSKANQTQNATTDTEGKNNNVTFSNNNNLNADATVPQDQLNFALTVKQQYALDNDSTLGPDTTVKTLSKIDAENQPIAGYTFDYADKVSGGVANSNDTSAGFSHNTGKNNTVTDDSNQARTKDIFELINEMDGLVDGVFINYFETMKADSLFIGITN